MNMLNHLSYTLLPVEVFLGNTKRTIGELKKLKVGNTLLLDKLTGEPLDVFINGKQSAKGEAVVIDENTGILALSYKQGSAILQEYKPARKQASPDTLTVLKCLRTREYESIIQRLCGRLPSVPAYRMYDACKELLCEVEPATLNRLFLEEIRKRKSPTGRLKSVPKELRQMILSLNLTQKKEEQLIAKLRSPIPWNRLEDRVSDPHIF